MPDTGDAFANQDTLTRTFGVALEDIAVIDGWIEQVGRDWGTGKRSVFGARLCVAELAANVIEHGSPKDGDHIAITLRRIPGGIAVEFADCGAPFDPTAVPDTPQGTTLKTVTIGGRGLLLGRAYAAEFTYRRDGGRNCITLKVNSG